MGKWSACFCLFVCLFVCFCPQLLSRKVWKMKFAMVVCWIFWLLFPWLASQSDVNSRSALAVREERERNPLCGDENDGEQRGQTLHDSHRSRRIILSLQNLQEIGCPFLSPSPFLPLPFPLLPPYTPPHLLLPLSFLLLLFSHRRKRWTWRLVPW